MSYCVHYRGLLQELRDIAPPADDVDDCDDGSDDISATANGVPHNRILVYDTRALIDTDPSMLRGLCCHPYNNIIVVPELVLDAFDSEDKRLRRQKVHNGGGAGAIARVSLTPSTPPVCDDAKMLPLRVLLVNTIKSLLLLDTQSSRHIVLQRVEQYNHAYIQSEGIDRCSRDPRLLVACALYFAQPSQLSFWRKKSVLVVASDDEVYTSAVRAQLEVCRGNEVYRSGHTQTLS